MTELIGMMKPLAPNGTSFANHDGFSKLFHFSDGMVQTQYVQFYKKIYTKEDKSEWCYTYSPKVPVIVTFTRNIPSSALPRLRGTGVVIHDYRDFDETCNTESFERTYFHDLPTLNELQISQIITSVGLPPNPITDPCTNISVNFIGLEWTQIDGDLNLAPYNTLHDPATGKEIFRVCADHISATEGEYSSKKYSAVAKFEFRGEYCSEVGETSVEPFSVTCSFPIENLTYTVRTREPGSVGLICEIDMETINALSVETGQINCSNNEIVTVCSDDKDVVIGPTKEETKKFAETELGRPILPGATFTYEWSPSTGISNRNIANPTVNYSAIPVRDGQVKFYSCKITINEVGGLNKTEVFHCTYVYKCSECSTELPASPLGEL